MTDVNEDIVRMYFEAQGYLVKTNHYYVKKTFNEDGTKRGQGASDIDLIIIHPKTYEKAIVSVKGWQNDILKKSNIGRWKENKKLKIDSQTIEAGKSFFGNSKFKKILVISCIKKKDYDVLKKELQDSTGYDIVLDFPTILHDLIEGNAKKEIEPFNDHKHYRDSEFLQTLRLIIKHYLRTKE